MPTGSAWRPRLPTRCDQCARRAAPAPAGAHPVHPSCSQGAHRAGFPAARAVRVRVPAGATAPVHPGHPPAGQQHRRPWPEAPTLHHRGAHSAQTSSLLAQSIPGFDATRRWPCSRKGEEPTRWLESRFAGDMQRHATAPDAKWRIGYRPPGGFL